MVATGRHPAPQEARRRRLRPALRGGHAQAQRGGLRAVVECHCAAHDCPVRRLQRGMTRRNRRRRAVFLDDRRGRLPGLEIFMRDDRSPLYRHGIVAKIVGELHRPAGEILLLLAQPAGLRRDLQDLARRKRLSGLPERARAGKRPAPGQPAAGRDPRGRRAAQRDGRLHPAPQGIPGGAAEADGRAALSGGRQGRQRCSARSCWPQTAKVSVNPKTLPALLSGALGDLRRHAPTCR